MKSPKRLAKKIVEGCDTDHIIQGLKDAEAGYHSTNGGGCACGKCIELALIEYGIQVKEECAKVAEGHYEEHCCEDCPCSYWRENTAKAIRSMEVGR